MNINNEKLKAILTRMVDETINDLCLDKTVVIGEFKDIQIQLIVTQDEDHFICFGEGQNIDDTPYNCVTD